MPAPAIVAGEALIDIVSSRSGTAEHVGGSPANVAIGLARLGHPTTLVTHVADDDRGRRIVTALRDENVDLTSGSTRADRTPTAQAQLDDAGAATYTFDLEWELDPAAEATPGAHLHTGSIACTLEPGATDLLALVAAAREQSTVSYDPNARPKIMHSAAAVLPRMEEFIGLSDVVKASDEDLEWLYPGMSCDEVLRRWHGLGALLALVTRGGDGAYVGVGGDVRVAQLAPAEVVDTVGAGDSFMAGLISGLLDAHLLGGVDARERLAAADHAAVEPAVQRALACAKITVARAGANPPRRDELDNGDF